MKKKLLALSVAAVCVAAVCLAAAPSDSVLSRKQILALMRKVNTWQLAHPVKVAADHLWERATWYTGVMDAWKCTGDRQFLDQALEWGRTYQWQVGTEPGTADAANKLFCAQTWLEVYFISKDRAMIAPAIRWADSNEPGAPMPGKRWYLDDTGRAYVDSLYGAAGLAMLHRATGNRKYLDIMHAFFDDVSAELLDKETGLYYRDNKYIGQRTANGKKLLWSRGNGWIFAGTARILEYLPKDDPHRKAYIELFRRMASGLVRRQGSDGYWRTNLDDSGEFPLPEASGTGFFCYGLAWGINHDFLPRAEYLPAATRAWAGLSANVDPDGRVLWGQPPAEKPAVVKPQDTREYVTGTFLLAASEMYKLAETK